MAIKKKKTVSRIKTREKVRKVELQDFKDTKKVKGSNSMELLKDIPLKVVVELGRTVLKIRDLMELGIGSIIELDKLSGDTMDILVNGKLIAKGEVVVIDEDFGVRITEVMLNTDLENKDDKVS